jgi:hypothetical protein
MSEATGRTGGARLPRPMGVGEILHLTSQRLGSFARGAAG